MTYAIRISLSADTDLKKTIRYISITLSNPEAAKTLINKFQDIIDSLRSMPKRHPLADDTILSDWGIRYLNCGHYLLFYQVDDAARVVNIIRFLHERQHWRSILGNSELD